MDDVIRPRRLLLLALLSGLLWIDQVRSQDMVCLRCKATNKAECDMSGVEYCPPDKQACGTIVTYNQTTGQMLIEKGCISASSSCCQETDYCVGGCGEQICHSCCSEHMCNQQLPQGKDWDSFPPQCDESVKAVECRGLASHNINKRHNSDEKQTSDEVTCTACSCNCVATPGRRSNAKDTTEEKDCNSEKRCRVQVTSCDVPDECDCESGGKGRRRRSTRGGKTSEECECDNECECESGEKGRKRRSTRGGKTSEECECDNECECESGGKGRKRRSTRGGKTSEECECDNECDCESGGKGRKRRSTRGGKTSEECECDNECECESGGKGRKRRSTRGGKTSEECECDNECDCESGGKGRKRRSTRGGKTSEECECDNECECESGGKGLKRRSTRGGKTSEECECDNECDCESGGKGRKRRSTRGGKTSEECECDNECECESGGKGRKRRSTRGGKTSEECECDNECDCESGGKGRKRRSTRGGKTSEECECDNECECESGGKGRKRRSTRGGKTSEECECDNECDCESGGKGRRRRSTRGGKTSEECECDNECECESGGKGRRRRSTRGGKTSEECECDNECDCESGGKGRRRRSTRGGKTSEECDCDTDGGKDKQRVRRSIYIAGWELRQRQNRRSMDKRAASKKAIPCFSCNATNNEDCNHQEIQYCVAGEVCGTVVTYTSTGVEHIEKGCIPAASTCCHQETQCMSGCDKHVCYACCDQPGCNDQLPERTDAVTETECEELSLNCFTEREAPKTDEEVCEETWESCEEGTDGCVCEDSEECEEGGDWVGPCHVPSVCDECESDQTCVCDCLQQPDETVPPPPTRSPTTAPPTPPKPDTTTPPPPPTTSPPTTSPPKTSPPKTDPPQTSPPKTDPPKTDPPRTSPPKTDPPKTSPATNPPPASDPPIQPPTCRLDADHCLQYFQENVVASVPDPTMAFSSFCRNMSGVYLCLSRAAEDCCHGNPDDSGLIHYLRSMYASCPDECRPEDAYGCVQDMYTAYAHTVWGTITCDDLPDVLEEKVGCVGRTVASCDQDVREPLEATVELIRAETNRFCEDDYGFGQPVTEEPSCEDDRGFQCVLTTGQDITLLSASGDDLTKACTSVEETEDCVENSVDSCSDNVKDRLAWIWDFTLTLTDDACEDVCDTMQARACVLVLWDVIERAKDFQLACSMVSNVTECVKDNTVGCTPEDQTSLQSSLINVLTLIDGRCDDIVYVYSDDLVEVTEGGPPAHIDYEVIQTLENICSEPGCVVTIEMELELGNNPTCGSTGRQPIGQAVLGWCVQQVEDDQGRQSLPLEARLDLKRDGEQQRLLWMRLVKTVDDRMIETRTLHTFTVTVVDNDHQAECKAINDPHVTTFDKHYYNNFVEGYFVFYKHTEHPYMVETVFQRCLDRATCTCGVAVQSGDSIFYVDRCRRSSWYDRCGEDDKYRCRNLLKLTLHYWDELTPGTRVFSKDDGSVFEVILPHGTMVRIALNGDYLNVWVFPSPEDWGRTEGLCGVYNGDVSDDLTLRNGEVYIGRGTDMGDQPVGFSKDWRMAADEWIHNGVSRAPYRLPEYCACWRDEDDSSVNKQTACGSDVIIELCDFDLSGEVTDNIYVLGIAGSEDDSGTINEDSGGGARRRRDTEDVLDLDPEYEGEPIPEEGLYNTSQATDMCESMLAAADVSSMCVQGVGIDVTVDVQGCVEDIMITDATDWMDATLEAVKQQCDQELSRDPVYSDTEEGQQVAQSVSDVSCPNQCQGQGNCTQGVCYCYHGYTGADCSYATDASPEQVALPGDGLCDLHYTQCQIVRVHGFGFIPGEIVCHLQKVQVTEEGVVEEEVEFTQTEGALLTQNEVHCPLADTASYKVKVSNTESDPSDVMLHVAYNSVCYHCTPGSDASCARKSESCVIENRCFAPYQASDDDDCMVCDPSQTNSEWTESKDCSRSYTGLAVLLAVIAAALIVAVIAGLVIHTKKRNKGWGLDSQADLKSDCSSVSESDYAKEYIPSQHTGSQRSYSNESGYSDTSQGKLGTPNPLYNVENDEGIPNITSFPYEDGVHRETSFSGSSLEKAAFYNMQLGPDGPIIKRYLPPVNQPPVNQNK